MADRVTADFRVLFERAPGLYLALDPHFFVLAATDSYLRALMARRADIVGQNLFDILPENPSDPAASATRNLQSSLDRVLREGVPDSMGIQNQVIRHPTGDFEQRYWSITNTPIVGADGAIAYIIHAVEDVTDFVRLKKSRGEHEAEAGECRTRPPTIETELLSRSEELSTINQQLKDANEELAMRTAELHDSLQTMQTFTYSIAHDLRAPLRALMSFSNVVLDEYASRLDENGQDCLRRIKAAAHRMDILVNDLLAYGQLTHVEVTAVPISLEYAVNKALQDLAPTIQARQAQINVERPLPTVVGNIALLNQVLVNLIDNALKFIPPERAPCITIHTKQENHRLRLCVSDNGIGIAPEYHGRIFELFARLHKPAEYSGTGIGLALVKKAMERMMGKVGVESALGEGSCFWLEFRGARLSQSAEGGDRKTA